MKPILAMTMGDPAGIGAECCVRAAAHQMCIRDRNDATPFLSDHAGSAAHIHVRDVGAAGAVDAFVLPQTAE